MEVNIEMERTVYNDLVQGTDRWHNLRTGRITSTSVGGLFVKGKDTFGLGAGLITECDRVIAELITGISQSSDYTNEYMEVGKTLEEEAAEVYELKTFSTCVDIGFISMGEYFGDSPDKHVNNDGCLEIKCPCAKVHQKYLRLGEVPKEHVAQMYWHMFVGEKQWCDFVSYNPTFPKDIQMIIHRLEMTDEVKDMIESKVNAIESHIKKHLGI